MEIRAVSRILLIFNKNYPVSPKKLSELVEPHGPRPHCGGISAKLRHDRGTT